MIKKLLKAFGHDDKKKEHDIEQTEQEEMKEETHELEQIGRAHV